MKLHNLYKMNRNDNQACTARVFHGLPKVSCHARSLYALQADHPPNGRKAVWGVARPQSGRPVAVFFPLDTPSRTGPMTIMARKLVSAILYNLGTSICNSGDINLNPVSISISFHFKDMNLNET
jgi:hypothetical protein